MLRICQLHYSPAGSDSANSASTGCPRPSRVEPMLAFPLRGEGGTSKASDGRGGCNAVPTLCVLRFALCTSATNYNLQHKKIGHSLQTPDLQTDLFCLILHFNMLCPNIASYQQACHSKRTCHLSFPEQKEYNGM